MLMGAELQAAILEKRNQLKRVPDPQQGAAIAASVAPAGGVGLHDVLRRGLQRFQMQETDEAGGNTEFIEAALRRNQS